MTNAHYTSVSQYADIESVNWAKHALERGVPEDQVVRSLAVKSRDNARTPMQWDASPSAGFTTGEPWIAVHPNHAWLNAAAQVDDPDSVFAHYRALVRLRHARPALATGTFAALLEDDPCLWVYTRTGADERLLVVVNCGREPRDVRLDEWYGAELVLGNLPRTPPTYDASTTTWAGWDARIYALPG